MTGLPRPRFATSTGLLGMLTRPATCGHDWEPLLVVQLVPGVLANGANSEPKSGPAVAVESLETIVLLMMFTANASCSDTPPPSQPATLLVMMLLVTVTEFHRHDALPGVRHETRPFGKLTTSVPLTCCSLRPPPLPLSAELPIIRLALITSPGPVPSLGGIELGFGTQSLSLARLHGGSGSGAPITSKPPPLAVMVGLVLWLNRIELCSISPFLLHPMCAKPPPSPVLILPHTQLYSNW